jgi:hypothetical protein
MSKTIGELLTKVKTIFPLTRWGCRSGVWKPQPLWLDAGKFPLLSVHLLSRRRTFCHSYSVGYHQRHAFEVLITAELREQSEFSATGSTHSRFADVVKVDKA